MKIKVIEAFRTFQGEGPHRGVACLLLRFKKCSRQIPCKFCDTQLKMRINVEFEYPSEEIQQTIEDFITKGYLIEGNQFILLHNVKKISFK